jgi:hypothetical protein
LRNIRNADPRLKGDMHSTKYFLGLNKYDNLDSGSCYFDGVFIHFLDFSIDFSERNIVQPIIFNLPFIIHGIISVRRCNNILILILKYILLGTKQNRTMFCLVEAPPTFVMKHLLMLSTD